MIIIDDRDGAGVSRAIGIALDTCQGRHAGLVTVDARSCLDAHAVAKAAALEPNALVILGVRPDDAALWERLLTLAIQPTWTINLRATPVRRIAAPQLVVTTRGDPPASCCLPSVWRMLDLRQTLEAEMASLRYQILRNIRVHGPRTRHELAASIGMAPDDLRGSIGTCVRDNLIERASDVPGNLMYRITRRGKEYLARVE